MNPFNVRKSQNSRSKDDLYGCKGENRFHESHRVEQREIVEAKMTYKVRPGALRATGKSREE